MAALIKKAYDVYKYVIYECPDPRTKDWVLVSGPVPILTILITYLYFCKSAGPRWMKDRQPFNPKYVMIVYNAIMVVFSTWMVYEALDAAWLRDYSYRCQPVDYSYSPEAMRVARGCWWYLLCKVIELLDTVFFVLRKKNNQISHLHLFHHAIMPINAWICVTYLPGGQATSVGLVNSFVHIVMYTYYLLAAFGPTVQKYLWWKKYITTLQLVQFVILFIHFSQVLIFDCDYSKIFIFFLSSQAVYFMYLFGAFYRKTYRYKKDI